MGRRRRLGDRAFGGVLGLLSLTPVAVVVGLGVYLVVAALPVFRMMGTGFWTKTAWTLGNLYANGPILVHQVAVMPGASFGGRVFVVGTVLTSVFALALAAPLAVMAAAAGAFWLPRSWRAPVSVLTDLMAGIPSVLYGLWGLTAVGPFVAHWLGPMLNRVLTPIPFVSGPVNGPENLLTATLVLAIMIVPIIAGTARAVMERVPAVWVDGARALGWTDAEVFRYVIWPFSRTAVVGAVILGWGRAVGETMAVLMVSGNADNVLPGDWYSAVATMAATIAAQLDSAMTDPTGMAVRALGALGLVLFLVTVGANLLARWLVRRAGVVEGAVR